MTYCSMTQIQAHLHWVASEAARVAGFPEALLAGRDEARRDGIPDNFPCENDLLGLIIRQRLHVAHYAPVLPLPTCNATFGLSG